MDTTAYYYGSKKRRIIVVLQHNHWAARNLKAKGFSSMWHILTRPATPTELVDMAGQTRLHFFSYYEWDGFFEDESVVGSPPETIVQLRDFARVHPLLRQAV